MSKSHVRVKIAFLLFFLFSGVSSAQNAAPSPQNRNEQKTSPSEQYPVITIHGRLFPVQSPAMSGAVIVLATAERTYYKLEGALLPQLKEKMTEIGQKEIWLTGKRSGPFCVDKTIKNVYNDAGALEKTYKETTEYLFFRVDEITKIGNAAADINAPAPHIGPLTNEELRAISNAKPPSAEAVIKVEGTIISVPEVKKIQAPFKIIQIKSSNSQLPIYNVMLSGNTKLFLVVADTQNRRQPVPSYADILKVGDRVEAWIIEKKTGFEAQTISIIK